MPVQPGRWGGGSFHPVFPLVGKTLSKGIPVVVEVGLTVISLVGVGKFLKAGGAISAVDAALVRLYQTGRVPWIGASTYYPPGWIGPAVGMIGGTISTWFTPPSSGGGGPGELPNIHRPPPSIEETGEILSNPPLVDELKDWARSKVHSSDPDTYRGRCRAVYRGKTGRYKSPVRCVKKGGHRGKHRSGRFTWKG